MVTDSSHAEYFPRAQGALRQLLRGLPVLKGEAPQFDPRLAPDDPVELFAEWLETAVESGVTEPHAMTLSTVSESGLPSARMLILKDVDNAGWHFAVHAASRKGRELAAHPAASLTFYWPDLVRQIRISGPVVTDTREISEEDFLARPIGSREMALIGSQSRPLTDPHDLDNALEQAAHTLTKNPDHVPAQWISYAVQPEEIEFWQGAPSRRHQRLSYCREDGKWSRNLLWP